MMKARTLTLFAAAISGTLMLPMPAMAQLNGNGTVLNVFGSDKCPMSNGEEIVVCRRFPEAERYRIPKDLREGAKDPQAPNWAKRATALEYVGRSGTNSCSASGAGGWTGCWSQLMNAARSDRSAP